MSIDIGEEERIVFDPSVWIHKGKTWDNPPLHVFHARDTAFELPLQMKKLLPAPDLPIVDFLQLKFPIQSHSLNIYSLDSWFSHDSPDTSDQACVDMLWRRSIPSVELLKDLRVARGQKWLDGAKSIRDPRYNRGNDLFPLWALTLWQTLGEMGDDQEQWKLGLETIRQDTVTAAHGFTTAARIFGQRGWNSDVRSGRFVFSSLTFLSLLCPTMINDDVTQAMTYHLQCRMEEDCNVNSKKHFLAASRFASVLKAAAGKGTYTSKKALPQSLLDIEELVEENPKIHTIAYGELNGLDSIGLRNKSLIHQMYVGDSLKIMPPPKEVIKNVQKWLQARFGGTFREEGNTITHGDQCDSISCIPITMNTIAHGIFGDSIWIHENRFLDRLWWFQQLVPDGIETVSTFRYIEQVVSTHHISQSNPSLKMRNKAPVKPTLANILNPPSSEEESLNDLMTFLCDEVEIDMREVQSEVLVGKDSTEVKTSVAVIGVDIKESEKVRGKVETDTSPKEPPCPPAKPLVNAWSFLDGMGNSKSGRLKSATGSSKKKRPASPTEHECDAEAKRLRKELGGSKSATSERNARTRVDAGDFDAVKQEAFKQEVRDLVRQISGNSHLMPTFYDDKPRVVHCPNCCRDQIVQKPYKSKRFRDHFVKCIESQYHTQKSKSATARTPKLTSETVRRKWDIFATRLVLPSGKPKPRSCPGLTETNHPRISIYLRRSAATGGGARSCTRIAKELFNSLYRHLSRSEKAEVNLMQVHEQRWKNDHQNLRVFSVECLHFSPTLDRGQRSLPCAECTALLKMNEFNNILRKEMPADENYKFTNHAYQNEVLGKHLAKCKGLRDLFTAAESDAENSIFIKFVQGILEGKYADNEVFISLIKTMVQKIDRQERGVGLQNFKYAPAWDEFVNILSIHSPRARTFLATHFQARTDRSIRVTRSRSPKLPPTICLETFLRVKAHLKEIDYNGPVGIACDDTKLFDTLQLSWDPKEKVYFLLGAVSGPIKVPNPEAVSEYMNNASIVKGTKLRLWTLQVPLPKIPPLIVAALPITDSTNASERYRLHMQIMDGLLDQDIKVLSYFSDGTEVERVVQRDFAASAGHYVDINLPNPHDESQEGLHIRVPIYRGVPIVMGQDSKHCLKTFRNNLFTGARLLTLGNHAAFYELIREMAFAENSPLFHRDVEKLDRQDDNAAARLFSAPALQYLADHYPDQLGVIVYLFVFGEVCDAYQNRHIPHEERIRIALRTHYFVCMWQKFIDDLPCYRQDRYCISRESVNILKYLICEHVFGISRRDIKDFGLLDFHQMIPKLNVQIREAIFNAHLTETNERMKARASGYHHTYSNLASLNIMALGHYPSDLVIHTINVQASDQADSLWALLGVSPMSLHDSAIQAPLPGITAFESADDDMDDSEFDHDDIFDEDFDHEMEELQWLIHLSESNRHSLTTEQQERLECLTNAAVALSIEDRTRLNALEDEMDVDEMYDTFVAEDRQILDDVRAMQIDIPNINTDQDTSVVIADDDLDDITLQSLISLRERHQTNHAARSVRTRSQTQNQVDSKQSLRQQITRRFYDELKTAQVQGITSGEGRGIRWYGSGTKTTLGNAANAATVAKATATKALSRRREIFGKNGILSLVNGLDTACVTEFRPIKPRDYGFVWTEKGICLAQVLTMYALSGGKNGKHAAVSSSTNIAALSYLAVQLFEPMHRGNFRIVSNATSLFQTKQFAHIPHYAFLLLVSPAAPGTPGMVKLTGRDDEARFNILKNKKHLFDAAVKEYKKRVQKRGDE
ncbi:hypothetical protein F5877DRAFT_38885 [Lentinula edodes]|nr:hypothetical protein F5877DRAFT_38885 [Lentinula edodes]